MALTRAMLTGMGLTEEQISAIIGEHTTITSALKDQINEAKEQMNQYKEQAEKLSSVQKELDDLKKDVADNDWKGKYDKEHSDFEDYKANVASKEKTSKVKDAYKKLLAECKVGEKHVDSILRVTDFSSMELDDNEALKDVDTLKEKINSDWSGFITSTETHGADVNNPPSGGGDAGNGKTGRAAELAAKYHDNLYGKKED